MQCHLLGLGTKSKGEQINGRSPVTFPTCPRFKLLQSFVLNVIRSNKVKDTFFDILSILSFSYPTKAPFIKIS